MKIHRNPPKNIELFNANYGQYVAANGVKWIGTVLGIVTEFAVITALINTHIAPLLLQNVQAATIISYAVSGILVFMLAKERINYAMEISKIIVLGKSNSIGASANINTLLIGLAVFAISGLISYLGSITMLNNTYTPPKTENGSEFDSLYVGRISSINNTFSKDSANTASTYNAAISAEKKRVNSMIVPLEVEAKRKKWLRSKLQPQIDSLYGVRGKAVAELTSEKNAALLQLSKTNIQNKQVVQDQTQSNIQLITDKNQIKTASATNMFLLAVDWFPAIIIVSLIMLASGCFVIVKFEFQCGIERVILPSAYDLLPSLLSEYREAFTDFFQYQLRSIAAGIRNKTGDAGKVTDANTSELVRINLKKYREKLIDNSDIDHKDNLPKPEASKPAAEQIDKVVQEYLNTYRIHRQRLQIYSAREQTTSNAAACLKHQSTMDEAEKQLGKLGYRISVGKNKITLVSV